MERGWLKAVPVQHQALEQPADGLQADVRMGRDLHAGTPADLVRAVVVEKAPGADGAQRPLRQQPADLGAVADGRLAGLDHVYRKVMMLTVPMLSLPEPHPDMGLRRVPESGNNEIRAAHGWRRVSRN